jgi:SAM-dependent methyltransferase
LGPRLADAPGRIAYLDTVRASPGTVAYKRVALRRLDVRPGDHVLDVGCGTGEDVAAIGRLVGVGGRAVGVDFEAAMVAEAERRAAGQALRFQVADAMRLPFPDASFDRCRADRVLQLVTDPSRALAEMVRVTKPGGLVLAANPDVRSFVLDVGAPGPTAKVLDYLRAGPFNQELGGAQLPNLFRDAGLKDVSLVTVAHSTLDADEVARTTPLGEVARLAEAAGAITPAELAEFLGALSRAREDDRFTFASVYFVVTGTKPPG